jgi:hypothetical protein
MHHVLNTSCVHFRSSETRLSGWLQLCHPVPCTDAPDCAPPWACLLGLLASCPWLPWSCVFCFLTKPTSYLVYLSDVDIQINLAILA